MGKDSESPFTGSLRTEGFRMLAMMMWRLKEDKIMEEEVKGVGRGEDRGGVLA